MSATGGDRPHYLYRCYDKAGRLLYVGCTINPRKRLSLHETSVGPAASRLLQRYMDSFVVDADIYPSEAAGHAAETVAIFMEQPVFNTHMRCIPGWLIRQEIANYEAGLPATDWLDYMARHNMHPSLAVRRAMRDVAA